MSTSELLLARCPSLKYAKGSESSLRRRRCAQLFAGELDGRGVQRRSMMRTSKFLLTLLSFLGCHRSSSPSSSHLILSFTISSILSAKLGADSLPCSQTRPRSPTALLPQASSSRTLASSTTRRTTSVSSSSNPPSSETDTRFRSPQSAYFTLSAASISSNLNLAANIQVDAYGISALNWTINTCDILNGVLCPLPKINFTGEPRFLRFSKEARLIRVFSPFFELLFL